MQESLERDWELIGIWKERKEKHQAVAVDLDFLRAAAADWLS